MVEWLTNNWLSLAVPLLAFLATYVVGVWLRGLVDDVLTRWSARVKWQGGRLVTTAVHARFLFWFLLLAAVIAVEVSVLPDQAKGITIMTAGTLFVASLGWTVVRLGEHLLNLYVPMVKLPSPALALSVNVFRILVIVITALVVLDIWGAPTSPLLFAIAVLVLAAALALRNVAPNVFAGFQLTSTRQINIGDYIKLETGEEGYVTEMGWNTTRVRGLDESIIIVPNGRMLEHTLVNYGRPLRKASEPFRFHNRTHLAELTGLRAGNLRELAEVLETAPESVVYYHTHRFLETQHYLTPEPSNDFGIWVSDSLGNEVLGERLSSLDTFDIPSLSALRDRLVSIIEEYLAGAPTTREAMPGEEFYFMKSLSFVLPTSYTAHDLREFVETLRRISLGSLYFHVFESRLRLGRGLNDFSVWMRDSLGEPELADEIARFDPYTYTLEGLRLALIQLIEKRIK